MLSIVAQLIVLLYGLIRTLALPLLARPRALCIFLLCYMPASPYFFSLHESR